MDNYSKVLTFFMENGVQLTEEQLITLKEYFNPSMQAMHNTQMHNMAFQHHQQNFQQQQLLHQQMLNQQMINNAMMQHQMMNRKSSEDTNKNLNLLCNATPLKGIFIIFPNVGDIKFGESRDKVRSKLGEFEDFSKTKNSKNKTDNFGNYHIYYDTDNKVEAIEIFPPTIVKIHGKVVFPSTIDQIKKVIKGLESEEDGYYINASKSIGVSVSENGKVSSILFGKKNYYE